MSIRDLRRDEIARLCEIERRCFSDPWSPELFLTTLKARFTHGQGIALGQKAERLVGYIIYQCFLGEGHILNFAVDPVYQRRGFGRLLLATVLHRMEEEGYTETYLELRKGNRVARRLYESVGFVACGERPGYYDNREDAIVMVRRVSKATQPG